MKNQKNKDAAGVVSRDLSRELQKRLRAARKKADRAKGPLIGIPQAPMLPMPGRYSRIMLQAKWAWRWRGCAFCGHDRHIEYSGGVSLTASCAAPGYGGVSTEKTWRLQSGWKPADYDRMVERATTWAIGALRVIEYREQVEREFDALPTLQRERAQAHGAQAGWPVMYAEMSIDDCERWLDYFKTLEGKK